MYLNRSLPEQQEDLAFTVCLQGTFASLDDHSVHWSRSVDIGKPLIARLDLHRAVRRNSCLQTCQMPHSPSHSPCHSPCHSPGPEHRLHLHHGSHQALDHNRLSPQHHYLDVYEPQHQGAVGGWGDYHNDNLNQSYAAGLSSPHGRVSIPIEATDDIAEIQTVFMNSLQFNQQ